MSTLKIKFNHEYYKLKNFVNREISPVAQLIQVLSINTNNLTKNFIVYDTELKYKLKEKQYLLLFFFRIDMGLFTTLRKDNKSNRSLYFSKIGETFDIEIVEDEGL